MSERERDEYRSSESEVDISDGQVIRLLIRHKRKLKVVNMLREEGMTYEDASFAVNNNIKIAQARNDRRRVVWRIVGILLALFALSIIATFVIHGWLGFFALIVLIVVTFVAYFCFRKRDDID